MRVLRSLVFMLLALAATAHALPLPVGTMEVVGDSVHSVIMVPAVMLSGADDDGDGQLSPEELHAHRTRIDRLLAARFRLFNGDEPERILQQDLQIPAREAADGRDADYLILTRHSGWTRPVENLRADVDLFPASGTAGQMLLRATNGSKFEQAVMHAGHMRHVFFHGAFARTRAAVVAGGRTLLREYDTFLILLAMLTVAFAWRHLLRW